MTDSEFNQKMADHARQVLGPKEMVHHPEHYKGCFMEVMDVLENFFTEEEVKGFCKGNAIKYILRKKDDPEQDLMKARQYLNYLIDGEF